jgi:hypothetical protein
MMRAIGYTRRTLPQESKRVPPPRMGQPVDLPQVPQKKAASFKGSEAFPLMTTVIPASRISAPR